MIKSFFMYEDLESLNSANQFVIEVIEAVKDIFYNIVQQTYAHNQTLKFLYIIGSLLSIILLLNAFYTATKKIALLSKHNRQKKLFSSIKDSIKQEELSKENMELRKLVAQCEELGLQIDLYTGRKNNSTLVSCIVYLVCRELGINKKDSFINFCVATVYDAGFLELPPHFLHSEVTPQNKRKLLRTHVLRGESYFNFVPKQYFKRFLEASVYHHEKPDGTGYPEHLIGNDIPLCARIIHVANGYASLTAGISRLSSNSKKVAIKRLKKHPEQYDATISDALEKVLQNKNI